MTDADDKIPCILELVEVLTDERGLGNDPELGNDLLAIYRWEMDKVIQEE